MDQVFFTKLNTMKWKDRQRDWQRVRSDVADSPSIDQPPYIVSNVSIIDGMYTCSGFSTPVLHCVRQYTYIFDLSHSSNRGQVFRISRNPGKGQVRDIAVQGVPGRPGAFISIYVGDGRPDTLYYYNSRHRGMGGVIRIVQ